MLLGQSRDDVSRLGTLRRSFWSKNFRLARFFFVLLSFTVHECHEVRYPICKMMFSFDVTFM